MKVLVLMDFTAPARLALAFVRARMPHARVRLVHVLERSGLSAAFSTPSAGIGGSGEALDATLSARLAEVQAELRQLGGGEVIEGEPVEVALRMAQAREVDLIVVGRDSPGLLSRMVAPSVVERLVKASPVPVLVIPGEGA
ncbi:universal stress protein [Deinococcus maricopensis]|uniref:UspA domain-containing protein n=1 Tax=Deinococcus maricopensis (strain DSM 21211 / LMG 22137 / NRRL B-23946 / LB-34) TaxID=709986 RepID=E8UBL6_DEIML|nr:universal stress protein [Deinococcus maricopensis]ADV68455.1 UspA domain-containing protein [Deinococcus maricopensis DSM 21211]